ncbi:hypothetical protein CVT26_003307 [Gymnopilus dilepis]|uniref:Uncharacterized protein n=1 Tax=Gymnopilus dilepis TaxID=231916 RepID=A0A409Y515_9AGAR|nr:hypothetical protein CVT26_003307 [Gymnopilus dilepis]
MFSIDWSPAGRAVPRSDIVELIRQYRSTIELVKEAYNSRYSQKASGAHRRPSEGTKRNWMPDREGGKVATFRWALVAIGLTEDCCRILEPLVLCVNDVGYEREGGSGRAASRQEIGPKYPASGKVEARADDVAESLALVVPYLSNDSPVTPFIRRSESNTPSLTISRRNSSKLVLFVYRGIWAVFNQAGQGSVHNRVFYLPLRERQERVFGSDFRAVSPLHMALGAPSPHPLPARRKVSG